MNSKTSRRNFLKTAAASSVGIAFGTSAAFSAKSYNNIIGANERVVMAVMGTNGRGSGMAQSFERQKNVVMRYVCDVEEKAIAKGVTAVEKAGGNALVEKDIRKLLEKKDLDGVLICAPDHWHAHATIMACQAGKHVYVEKPCSHNPNEGELMIQAARKYNKVVQVGAQRRSWPVLMQGIKELHEGVIGRVYFAKGWYTNNRGSIGIGRDIAVPSTLDFDLWQGPAPRRAYKDNLIHYNWHWFWHWGTGEALNNGTHEIDVIRWGLNADYPTSVSSEGGRFRFSDDWETPDTQTIDIRFGNDCLVTWEGRSCNSRHTEGRDRGVIFYGENGSLETGGNSYKIFDLKNKLVKEITSKDIIDGRDTSSPNANLDGVHIENFLNAVKNNSRPSADIEELHKSTLLVQLGNIAWRSGSRLEINPINGHIINNSEAEKFWGRTYEPGWELKI